MCPMNRAPLPLLAVAVLTVTGGCRCIQTGYVELRSPDGRYVAVERETDCSATDPFATAITIRSRQARFGLAWLGHASRSIFLADVALHDVHVEWADSRNLKITCTGCEEYGVAEKVGAWRYVRVKFDVGAAPKGVF